MKRLLLIPLIVAMCSCAAMRTEDTRSRLDEYTNATSMASADEFVFWPNGGSIVQNLTWGTLLTEFQTDTSAWDMSSDTLELPNSTSLPGSCSAGQIYMDTDATTGQQIYGCESGSWVLQGGGGAGTVDTTGTVNANEIPYFSDSDTLAAYTESEFKAAYNMVAGTDYLAPISASDPYLQFDDTDGAGADDEAARIYANMGTTTDGAEDSDLWFTIMQAGSRTTIALFDESDNRWEFIKKIYLEDDIQIEDDQSLIFGAGSGDWSFSYDELTDDQLELISNSASDTTFLITNSGAGDAALVADKLGISGLPWFELVDSELSDTTTPHDLEQSEVRGTRINSWKATPEAKVFNLPAANSDLSVMFICGTSSNIEVAPDGTETMWLNGVEGSASQSIVNEACSAPYESVQCDCRTDGSGTYVWVCESEYTDWAFD